MNNYFHNSRLNKYSWESDKHEFDRELRLLNLELLERIELNFKKHLISFFENNWGLKNEKLYNPKFLEKTLVFLNDKELYLKKESRDIKKNISNSEIVELEINMFIDKITFWEVVKIFKHLNIRYKKIISNYYSIKNYLIFENFIQILKYIRNISSHHSNLYNIKGTFKIHLFEVQKVFWNRISYLSYFSLLSFFEYIFLDNNHWQNKVIRLLNINNIWTKEINLWQIKSLPSQLESEAWEELVKELYSKVVKKSNIFWIKNKKINIILALDEKNGLGKDWDLAWRIREDMKYFSEISTWNKKNAVVMWRKTWYSIPEKYRPLPDRLNCVLSRDTLNVSFKKNIENKDEKKRHIQCVSTKNQEIYFSDFYEAIKKISQDENIWEIFIIWWAQIYNLALQNPNLWKIYLTRVKWDFDCDVFVDFKPEEFDLIENSGWKKTQKGIEFRFEVYERN